MKMKGIRRLLRISVLTTVLACISGIIASAIPSRPEPQRLVNDYASILSQGQISTLENMLVEFDDSTSNQIAIVTTLDLEGYDISEYATRIGIEWQVGSEKFDNGIVIAVKPKTGNSGGKVFIAVGYGLEGAIPDAYVKRIIEGEMIPHFVNNDYYSGISAACDTLMKLASGEISEPQSDDEEDLIYALISIILILAISIWVIIIVFDNNSNNGSGGRRTVIYTGPIITTGNNYGGFGRGGFGGGGSFGGGFGGFGGGSFGGGGAGGSW